MKEYSISGNIVDLVNRSIFLGTITIKNGKIDSIVKNSNLKSDTYILPGFVDAHIHIESSMLIPSEFARLAVIHGTVATVSDPHEIGNVLGIEGVRYMINNAKKVPFHFYFGAPSCVPATQFETAGAKITEIEIEQLFKEDGLKYLSEMMNYPGVINQDPNVIKKLKVAQKFNLPIDGHAPGLKGDAAIKYINAGISTDHECYMLEEALHKLEHGMKIIIREGSAAKNYNALHSLLKSHPEKVMFCSDDKHPHELEVSHINEIVKRSVLLGYDLFDVLRAATINPIDHYNLNVGYLQTGQNADFIVVDDLKNFNVLQTYIQGILVAIEGKSLIPSINEEEINQFNAHSIKVDDLIVKGHLNQLNVIEAIDGQLITNKLINNLSHENIIESNTEKDILKLVVTNRYKDAKPSVAFIKGFKFKKGAIASSIAHDSHNVIAVGVDDSDICLAINTVIHNKGGISLVNEKMVQSLALPVAGLMSNQDAFFIAKKYAELESNAKNLGSSLKDPFMTLSFMALLVIPSLKLSDKGLFDTDTFSFIPLTF